MRPKRVVVIAFAQGKEGLEWREPDASGVCRGLAARLKNSISGAPYGTEKPEKPRQI